MKTIEQVLGIYQNLLLGKLMEDPEFKAINSAWFDRYRLPIYKEIKRHNKPVSKEDLIDVGCDEEVVKSIRKTNLEISEIIENLKKAVIAKQITLGNLNGLSMLHYEDGEYYIPAAWVKKSSREILEEIKQQYNHITDKTLITPDDVECPAFNLEEVPGAYEVDEWLVENLFRCNTFNIISAKSKGGKSQLAYQLATCINNGIDFLGCKVKEGKCLYVDYELKGSEIFQRGKSCLDFLGVSDPKDIRVMPLKMKNVSFEAMANGVRRELANDPEINVIFYDNFYSFFHNDQNNSSEVREALDALASISPSTTNFLICHNNKSVAMKGGSDDPIFAASGSNAFSAYADEFVSIEEKTDGKIIHIAGRHVQHQKIACLYNEKTKYFFQEIVDESEIQKIFKNTTKIYGRSRDYLKKNYPELYEYIANEENPRTTIAICKVFPNETKDTLREKGFWYSGKNLDRLKKGAKTETWYVRDVLK